MEWHDTVDFAKTIAGREGAIEILMSCINNFKNDSALQIRACLTIQTLSSGGEMYISCIYEIVCECAVWFSLRDSVVDMSYLQRAEVCLRRSRDRDALRDVTYTFVHIIHLLTRTCHAYTRDVIIPSLTPPTVEYNKVLIINSGGVECMINMLNKFKNDQELQMLAMGSLSNLLNAGVSRVWSSVRS